MILEGYKDRLYKDIFRKCVYVISFNIYICLIYVWLFLLIFIILFNFILFVGFYEGVVLLILMNDIFKILI